MDASNTRIPKQPPVQKSRAVDLDMGSLAYETDDNKKEQHSFSPNATLDEMKNTNVQTDFLPYRSDTVLQGYDNADAIKESLSLSQRSPASDLCSEISDAYLQYSADHNIPESNFRYTRPETPRGNMDISATFFQDSPNVFRPGGRAHMTSDLLGSPIGADAPSPTRQKDTTFDDARLLANYSAVRDNPISPSPQRGLQQVATDSLAVSGVTVVSVPSLNLIDGALEQCSRLSSSCSSANSRDDRSNGNGSLVAPRALTMSSRNFFSGKEQIAQKDVTPGEAHAKPQSTDGLDTGSSISEVTNASDYCHLAYGDRRLGRTVHVTGEMSGQSDSSVMTDTAPAVKVSLNNVACSRDGAELHPSDGPGHTNVSPTRRVSRTAISENSRAVQERLRSIYEREDALRNVFTKTSDGGYYHRLLGDVIIEERAILHHYQSMFCGDTHEFKHDGSSRLGPLPNNAPRINNESWKRESAFSARCRILYPKIEEALRAVEIRTFALQNRSTMGDIFLYLCTTQGEARFYILISNIALPWNAQTVEVYAPWLELKTGSQFTREFPELHNSFYQIAVLLHPMYIRHL